jgi:soluble lytic murein transglycosylase-like protein
MKRALKLPRTLEQAAAGVIWQESRFNARAVSPKGASGIAQFMPQTASWHALALKYPDPKCG